jgi:hypothetical protein
VEFTPRKVGFEDAEADDAVQVTLFISTHIQFILFGLFVHRLFIHDPGRIPPLSPHNAPRCYANRRSFARVVGVGAVQRPGAGGGPPVRHTGLSHRDEGSVLSSVPGQAADVLQQRGPGKELGYSGNGDPSSGIERFVGALAVATYGFRRKDVPKSATLRELVTVLAHSEGLDDRPPYFREQALVQGVVTDIQAFGYDESAVPGPERAALRVSRSRTWTVYRQELFLDGDSEPFGVVDWKHTLNRIELVQANGRAGPNRQ